METVTFEQNFARLYMNQVLAAMLLDGFSKELSSDFRQVQIGLQSANQSVLMGFAAMINNGEEVLKEYDTLAEMAKFSWQEDDVRGQMLDLARLSLTQLVAAQKNYKKGSSFN
jgi:hypothetical protein